MITKLKRAKREKDATSKKKLSNFKITKFKETHPDWMQLWGKFELEIEKSNITSVAKPFNLEEYVDPKVIALIDDLPCTLEGCNCAT